MLSDDHLRNSLTTQGLAPNELLLRGPCERIEYGRDDKENGAGDQARRPFGKTDKLDTTQDGVHGSAHPVSCETADESVEFGRSGTDSKQEGDFNEEDDEGGGTGPN